MPDTPDPPCMYVHIYNRTPPHHRPCHRLNHGKRSEKAALAGKLIGERPSELGAFESPECIPSVVVFPPLLLWTIDCPSGGFVILPRVEDAPDNVCTFDLHRRRICLQKLFFGVELPICLQKLGHHVVEVFEEQSRLSGQLAGLGVRGMEQECVPGRST